MTDANLLAQIKIMVRDIEAWVALGKRLEENEQK